MGNTFMETLTNGANMTYTTNGAKAYKSTNSKVYDMFAFGGAYRRRSDADCILLFKEAFEEDAVLALKCLFYLRDCRGGQGERRFFRVCFRWLVQNYPDVAQVMLPNVSEYGRWDDLIYTCLYTDLEDAMALMVKTQFVLDLSCRTPSLLGKWMPSENASALETKKAASKMRNYLGMTHKQYRQALSNLRSRINIVEKLMSENRWSEIEFDKLPSKAGLIYKNAFARRDLLAKKYEQFIKSADTKVNAKTLYPYEVVAEAKKAFSASLNSVDRAAVEKYWNNLPDYLNGEPCKMMCVVDTSGSMTGYNADAPINVAISLGMYCAERIGGDFKNHYISFSSRPQFINITGVDFVDKVQRIYRTNLCENTNIEATFALLKDAALKSKPEDRPETIVIISDMQIDSMSGGGYWNRGVDTYGKRWTQDSAATEMELIRKDWEQSGLECPKLVYWNVNASNSTILDAGPNVSFVSGCSPTIFEQVLTGVSGYDLMLKKLMSERYEAITL